MAVTLAMHVAEGSSKGFSQFFVISPDDILGEESSPEQDTDHVVRVVKESGSSRVVGV